MKRIALSLAAVSILGIMAARAQAEGALARPMGAHVAAKYGIQLAGHPTTVVSQVSHRRHGQRGYRGYDRGHRGYYRGHPGRYSSPMIIQPYWGHPAVIVPAPAYRYRGYYHGPQQSFRYRGPSISFGFGW